MDTSRTDFMETLPSINSEKVGTVRYDFPAALQMATILRISILDAVGIQIIISSKGIFNLANSSMGPRMGTPCIVAPTFEPSSSTIPTTTYFIPLLSRISLIIFSALSPPPIIINFLRSFKNVF